MTIGRIGYACLWDPNPTSTWSGSAWALMCAMQKQIAVADVGKHLGGIERGAWRLAYLRRRNQNWESLWRDSWRWQQRVSDDVRSNPLYGTCDAVLQIHDHVGVLDKPYFIYQDISTDMVLRELDHPDNGVRYQFGNVSRDNFERYRARQHEVFASAAGLIAMSAHYADSLVRDSGVPRAKVHIAYPGASALNSQNGRVPRRQREGPRTRLLFVGTNFMVKAGDVVVRAYEILRRNDLALTLTVVGPEEWPMRGTIPDGVDFRGRVPRWQITALMDQHDLLVMPSRLEGFGLVFIEAMARGLPCVGRTAFAMPELIEPGITGGLVDSLEPNSLAETIAQVLADDAIYAEVDRRAPAVAQRFTWENTAASVIDFMAATCE